MIETLTKFFTNPVNLLMVLFVLYRVWKQFEPFPEIEGGPESIANLNEFQELLKNKKGHTIIIDFYATWCGPCKTAAPVFHKMSLEPEFENVLFRKVNVDAAADVSRACEVQAMPTFKIFRDGKNSLSVALLSNTLGSLLNYLIYYLLIH